MFRNPSKHPTVSAKNSLRKSKGFRHRRGGGCPEFTDANRLGVGLAFKLGLCSMAGQNGFGDKCTTAWAQGLPITRCWELL